MNESATLRLLVLATALLVAVLAVYALRLEDELALIASRVGRIESATFEPVLPAPERATEGAPTP